MMDCSRTEVFLAELKRMCNSFGKCSYGCPLYDFDGGSTCDAWTLNHNNAEKAIEIVQKWSNSQQAKTRLSVLKEHFPNYRRDCNGEPGEPEICAEDLFGIECPYPVPEKGVCMKCWNTPIEGVQ